MVSVADEMVLSETLSVCPECLRRIRGERVQRGDDVYLRKFCPDHGEFSAIIWRGRPSLTTWTRPKTPSYPAAPFTTIDRGCPFDCGLCPEHRQHSCTVLLEITSRCDLRCPVCFAGAGAGAAPDPDLPAIERWFRRLLDAGGPFNIQLSGGEPCQRDDLPQIVALGRSLGFSFLQLNTNGVRLARDRDYVKRLVDAGLSSVFLQFDGLREETQVALRGRALSTLKRSAIDQCSDCGLGVVLVPTVVPGVNVDEIGEILRFALQRAPIVRGVHFQPISYFGRYPAAPDDDLRITIPEVIGALEATSRGTISAGNFAPPGCENALCSFHGNFVVMPDGALAPLTAHASGSECCTPRPAAEGAAKSRAFVSRHWAAPPMAGESSPPVQPRAPSIANASFQQSMGGWDTFLERARTHTFCISGMAFQDAWTLDLERLRDCCIHVMSPEGNLVPFCAYNLTSRSGRALYRGNHEQETT